MTNAQSVMDSENPRFDGTPVNFAQFLFLVSNGTPARALSPDARTFLENGFTINSKTGNRQCFNPLHAILLSSIIDPSLVAFSWDNPPGGAAWWAKATTAFRTWHAAQHAAFAAAGAGAPTEADYTLAISTAPPTSPFHNIPPPVTFPVRIDDTFDAVWTALSAAGLLTDVEVKPMCLMMATRSLLTHHTSRFSSVSLVTEWEKASQRCGAEYLLLAQKRVEFYAKEFGNTFYKLFYSWRETRFTTIAVSAYLEFKEKLEALNRALPPTTKVLPAALAETLEDIVCALSGDISTALQIALAVPGVRGDYDKTHDAIVAVIGKVEAKRISAAIEGLTPVSSVRGVGYRPISRVVRAHS